MKTLKKTITNGIVLGITFFLTVGFMYVAYGYVSGLGGKIVNDPLTSANWNSLVANVDEVKTSLNSISNIPVGFVGSFNLAICPSGWTEYTLARGRFIRGIDSTGTNDSVRVAGNLQTDELKSHTHWVAGGAGGSDYQASGYIGSRVLTTYPTGATGGSETRPKNVALLFCQKN